MNPVLPREFTDSVGVTWTVREIVPGPMPPKMSEMLGGDRRRGGWLLFLSADGEKRRLGPVPAGWAGLSDGDLEGHCRRARRVPPAPQRRTEDHEPSDGQS
jgi:hypothetical protein